MSGPQPLYDRRALRGIETHAAAMLGEDLLMQRAGLAAWNAVLAHWPGARRITVACGPGNNGGDGWVLARRAHDAGRDVCVLEPDMHAASGPLARRMRQAYLDAGGRVLDDLSCLDDCDLIVDAVFGIGLSRAPDGPYGALVDAINAADAPVFALDVPSGIDADTGQAYGVAIRATRTLQFIAAHAGLATGDALEHVGISEVADLDIAQNAFDSVQPAALRFDAGALRGFLPPRRRNAHKGDSGRVLCIGGDEGKGGAVLLCADAALHAGAGLVEVATRNAHIAPLLARRPEAMAHAVDDGGDISKALGDADVVAIGPGLGRAPWGCVLFGATMDAGKPLIVDADALNLLAEAPRKLPAGTILTPHPGEAGRLLGIDTRQVQADRFAAAHALCERYGCVVVLKGAGTLVAAPGETVRVIDAGNPGMAVGGMGDLLTGTIAALRAQGLDAFDAATCGALLHAAAGDAAADEAGQRGLLPTDLLPHLRRLSNP